MTEKPKHIIETPLDQELGDRYLSYALSTIMSRSLPDVRDGLKPVHRRILYAMKESGNTAEKPYRKSASAVGYVMMRYHPHGDSAIYDALVRMAQPFASRYPLVDGQGNFGSLDGDNAAAMRYTEARLTPLALALMEGIDENAVDFQPSYNGEHQEPQLLPARFPNLLANGSTGIAVGMATNIPPHNLDELCQALIHLLHHPKATTKELMSFIQGPDFPTGGIIVDTHEDLIRAYETGRGSFRTRAKWITEPQKGGGYQIIVTEIPYQVQKARLIEKLADLWAKKKLPLLADIRDESTVDVRIILIPKNRTVEPELLMESLFKETDLEMRFNLNMNVLDKGRVPKVMALDAVLRAFLDHRLHVLERRSHHRIGAVTRRLEILDGFLLVYLNVDDVIHIIRFDDNPKKTLQERFPLTLIQAEAILNMRLRSLRQLEEMNIQEEHKKLTAEKNNLEALMASPAKQRKVLTKEMETLRKLVVTDTVLGPRRTHFEAAPVIDIKRLDPPIEKEAVTIVCSKKGWIRAFKGHVSAEDLKYKEGDEARFVLQGETTDKLILCASNGRFYTLNMEKLPGGRSQGEPLSMHVDLETHEKVIALFLFHDLESLLFLVSKEGKGFKVKINDVLASTRSGKQVFSKDITPLKCLPLNKTHVGLMGENRKLLFIEANDIPLLNRGKGVTLQKFKEAHLSDAVVLDLNEGMRWQVGERTRYESDLRPWLNKRGTTGRLAPLGFPRHNQFLLLKKDT